MDKLEKAARDVIRCRMRDANETKRPMVIPSDFALALDRLKAALPDPRDRILKDARRIFLGRSWDRAEHLVRIEITPTEWDAFLTDLEALDK